MSVKSEQVDLYLLGTGVAFPDHLTLQTIEIFSKCAVICTNLSEEGMHRIPADIREKCISLWPLYRDGRIRRENYHDVTEAVLREAEIARPAAWLTPGHPMIFDSVSKALLEAARKRKWTVSIVPAISSLDTLLAELEYDPADGLIVHDATVLVRRRVPLAPSAAVILLQMSAFLSDRAHLTLEKATVDLGPLRDYLIKYFPATHKCAVVRSSSVVAEPPKIAWIVLDELPSVPVEVTAGATLFVPRVD